LLGEQLEPLVLQVLVAWVATTAWLDAAVVVTLVVPATGSMVMVLVVTGVVVVVVDFV
jgi:ABC-type thiamin/hydroxymethylpyrimidine transport system permease subunit